MQACMHRLRSESVTNTCYRARQSPVLATLLMFFVGRDIPSLGVQTNLLQAQNPGRDTMHASRTRLHHGSGKHLQGWNNCLTKPGLSIHSSSRLQWHVTLRTSNTARQKHVCLAASNNAHNSSSNGSSAPSSPWPAPNTVIRERICMYDHLQGDDFRHPLDQQNTSMLRSLPGLEVVAKNVMGPAAEQVLLLENIATSVKIGPEQLPSIHRLLLEAARTLQMEPPELYVRQNPVPNAYTLAIAGRQPFIVVHTALLELLTPRELQAVIAHELGHLKCDHGVWLTVANVIASGTVSLLPVVTDLVQEALLRWLRAAELTCDRAALLVAQDPKVVIGALMKLAGGSPSFANELNVDAFLEQARSYEEATSSVIGWYLRNAQTRALSHPLPVMRAKEIDRWAQSHQFQALLNRNNKNKIKVVDYLVPSSFNKPSNSNGAAHSSTQPAAAGPPAAPHLVDTAMLPYHWQQQRQRKSAWPSSR